MVIHNQFESLGCVAEIIHGVHGCFFQSQLCKFCWCSGNQQISASRDLSFQSCSWLGRPAERVVSFSLCPWHLRVLFLKCKKNHNTLWFLPFFSLACFSSTPSFSDWFLKAGVFPPPPALLLSCSLIPLLYCDASDWHEVWILKMCHWRCPTAVELE